MMDTQALEILTAFFEPRDHEFLRGFTYITEGAITTRLDSVDPNWTLELLNLTTRGDQCIAHCRLQVLGVWRDNVGMAKPTIKEGNEINEPEKAAVTDGLKRCARLFGIGRYLLDLPSSVKDMQSLERWMAGTGQPPQTPEKPRQQAQQRALQQAQVSLAPSEDGGAKPDWSKVRNLVLAELGKVAKQYHWQERANTFDKMAQEGAFQNEMTTDEIVDLVVIRLSGHREAAKS
jgi:hypothetical protein